MVTFEYLDKTLTLRNPDFGNGDSVESRRINRKTVGGDLIVKRDSNWPVTEILDFTFSYLKESEINAIIDFLKITLGKQISMTDYEGREWLGVIINPSDGVATRGNDNVSINIKFQGNLS